MAKYRVTHDLGSFRGKDGKIVKPEVGEVLDFDEVPACMAGKCEPVVAPKKKQPASDK